MMLRKILGKVVVYSLVAILLFWVIFPIYWIMSVSFKSGAQLFTWPPTYIPNPPTLQNYIEGIKTRPILPAMRNSLIVMVISTPISVLLASLAAFSMARYSFRGKELLRYGILGIRMIPGIIIAIPLFIIFNYIGLKDNLLSLIIVYLAFNMPFNIWMLTGFFEEIPKEIEEAALIDGASPWQLFSKIFFPLATPGLVASLISCMLLSWNEFQFALVLTFTENSKTLPIVIAGMTNDRGTYFGQMGAAGMLSILPVLAVGIYIQKYLVQGLTSGAVKG